ncbi:MAG TPA: carbamoyltransferase C-terminal domain-containing protein [bacterium]|nr:carbamoyltransferase C-terminal domain-containing protein [bacterium]
MRILGVSAHYHDSAAALLDGDRVYAACEERFTRLKHDPGLPINAISFCLREADIIGEELDLVAIHEKPLRKLKRFVSDCFRTFPFSYSYFRRALPVWLGRKCSPELSIASELRTDCRFAYVGHHLSHAASAYYPSAFEEAAVLTVDAVGEAYTTCTGIGKGESVVLDRGVRFPNSLGMFYSAMTYLLGFEVMDGEGKVMGLAAHGEPGYRRQVGELIRLNDDGSFALDMRYFQFDRSTRMVSPRLEKLIFPRRRPDEPIEQRHKDLAATAQQVLEEALISIVTNLRRRSGQKNLCIAGGVGLNTVANGRILENGGFDDIFIQPAAGDSGCSLGAALYASCKLLGRPRPRPMVSDRLGPAFREGSIARFLEVRKLPFKRLGEEETLSTVARRLADNKVVGWFQGKMEFGPRALGGRSILANPINPQMKNIVNSKVKFREPFRPFAASVPAEVAHDYFEHGVASPFMMLVFKVRPEKQNDIPSVTHLDGTCRTQTVTRECDQKYHSLLLEFGRLTGVPVLLNTSFNLKGEPIVCTPRDALKCFMESGMDCLAMENIFIEKQSTDEST